MDMQLLLWLGFIILVCFFLALDLGVFNKNPHKITAKEALGWTAVWVMLAVVFGGFVYYLYETNWMNMLSSDNELLYNGDEALLRYYTGFLIEKSLSLDNIFVMALIFTYFRIPIKFQHEILFWGILGAMIFRGIMIFAGVVLISYFSWLTYIFGVLLLYSAVQMMLAKENDEVDMKKNPVLRFLIKLYPVHEGYSGGRFFVNVNGKKAMTILFIALVIVETTDILFAIDSIPAIFAITTDPFLIFTSNIFAILGLRSLYFVLADLLDKFRYLKYSLILILGFVGVKMLILHYYKLPALVSLSVIIGLLVIGVVASLMNSPKEPEELEPAIQPERVPVGEKSKQNEKSPLEQDMM